MTASTTFERAVYCAEYQAKRALAAGRAHDTRQFARHERIMRELIEGSEFPELAENELAAMLGRSKAAVLKVHRTIMVL